MENERRQRGGAEMTTRARGVSRFGYEEKGKMATRSTDVYLPKEGMKEVAVCIGCGAFYWNKRWYLTRDESMKPDSDMATNEVNCPACQRMQENIPAGIATFAGDYLVDHESEILNTIKNVEEKVRVKNPLARIMEIRQEGNVLTITTTNDKLAERLGRDIYKAHSGKLEYQWSKEESFVRVNWSR
jgi:NMD protein affecting ribosome stability and mRNA decay